MHSSRRLQKDESENEERKEKEGGLRKKAWQNNLDFLLFRIITNQKEKTSGTTGSCLFMAFFVSIRVLVIISILSRLCINLSESGLLFV